MENFKSTKFVTSMVCLVMVFIAFMVGKLEQETFMTLVLGTLGTFTAGNTISKFSNTNSAD